MGMRLLPKPSDAFVGRVEEIKRIRDFFSKRRLFFLEGIEGIGKTSLALSLANSLDEEKPDRVFWIPCKSGWQADSFLNEILAWLPGEARAAFAQWEEGSASGIHERLMFLVNLLNRHGAMVFVDDLHLLESEYFPEILSILKTYLRDSRFFFSIRERPPLAPMEILDIFEEKLEGLSAADGLALFENLLESHGYALRPHIHVLEAAVSKMAGHPLLIKTFAALVMEGLGDPAEMMEKLPDFFKEMESSLFQRIMDGLSSEEVELLRLLSVSRIPLPRELTGEPRLREKLERRFLLSRDEKGRLSIHGLIREYILKGLAREGTVPIHGQLADYFRTFLEKGDGDLDLAREVLYHYFQAQRLDDARNLLMAWGGTMCSRGYYEEVLRFTALAGPSDFRLGILRANVLSILGRWEEGIQLLKEMEESLEDRQQLAEVRSALAGAYMNTGRLGLSLKYYEKVLAVFRASGDLTGAMKALNYITFIHGFRSEREKAMAYSNEALDIARRSGHEAALAHGLRMLGVILLESNRFEEALEVSRECLEKARALGSLRLICWARLNMCNALLGLGRIKEALECCEESLVSGIGSYDSQVIGFSRLALARIHREEGALESSVSDLAEARTNFIRQGNFLGEAFVKHLLALLYLELGKRKEAENLLRETLEAAIKDEHCALEILARESLAHLCLERGEAKAAADFAGKNLESLAHIEREESRGEAALILAEAAWRQREQKKVEHLLKLAIETGEKFRLPSLTARALFLAGHISGEKADSRAARIEEARAILEGLGGSRKRLAQRYFERIEQLTKEKYFIKTRQGERIVQRDDVESLRARMDEFTFFVDLPRKIIWERDKGNLDLFGKRILSTLLIFLVRNAGRGFTQEQLFSSVWGYEFDDLTSAGEVRKNISRLRDLVEPDRKNCRYIRLAEGLMKEKGKYFFDINQDFCFIEELREGG
jgi:tetratricopeptide (TPR) repeat protein